MEFKSNMSQMSAWQYIVDIRIWRVGLHFYGSIWIENLTKYLYRFKIIWGTTSDTKIWSWMWWSMKKTSQYLSSRYVNIFFNYTPCLVGFCAVFISILVILRRPVKELKHPHSDSWFTSSNWIYVSQQLKTSLLEIEVGENSIRTMSRPITKDVMWPSRWSNPRCSDL